MARLGQAADKRRERFSWLVAYFLTTTPTMAGDSMHFVSAAMPGGLALGKFTPAEIVAASPLPEEIQISEVNRSGYLQESPYLARRLNEESQTGRRHPEAPRPVKMHAPQPQSEAIVAKEVPAEPAAVLPVSEGPSVLIPQIHPETEMAPPQAVPVTQTHPMPRELTQQTEQQLLRALEGNPVQAAPVRLPKKTAPEVVNIPEPPVPQASAVEPKAGPQAKALNKIAEALRALRSSNTVPAPKTLPSPATASVSATPAAEENPEHVLRIQPKSPETAQKTQASGAKLPKMRKAQKDLSEGDESLLSLASQSAAETKKKTQAPKVFLQDAKHVATEMQAKPLPAVERPALQAPARKEVVQPVAIEEEEGLTDADLSLIAKAGKKSPQKTSNPVPVEMKGKPLSFHTGPDPTPPPIAATELPAPQTQPEPNGKKVDAVAEILPARVPPQDLLAETQEEAPREIEIAAAETTLPDTQPATLPSLQEPKVTEPQIMVPEPEPKVISSPDPIIRMIGEKPTADVPRDLMQKSMQPPLPEEPLEPQNPSLSAETKRVLENLPGGQGSPKPIRPDEPVKIKHSSTPEMEVKEGKVDVHEAKGVQIAVKRPQVDVNHLMEEGYNALMQADFSTAMSRYQTVLEADPSLADAKFGLATTYHRMGELIMARDLYAELLQQNPDNLEALNNLLVLVSQESPQEALVELRNLEAKNPDFSPIPAQMAAIYAQMRNFDAAIESIKRAVRIDPSNLAYRYNEAVLSDRAGRREAAIALYVELKRAYDRGEDIPASIGTIQERLTFLLSNRG